MTPTTPLEHSIVANPERNKPDEKEDTPVAAQAGRQEVKEQQEPARPRAARDWSQSHTAFEQLHSEMAEVAGLASAAFDALLELPRGDVPEGRRQLRTLTGLLRATRDYASNALYKSDRWIEHFEGRPIYYAEDELTDHDELLEP